MAIFYLFLLLFVFSILLSFFYSIFRAISWVPMWPKDLKRFLKLAELKEGQCVYDLGCGDGKILFASAKLGAIAKGYEISVLPYIIAQLRWLFSKNKKNVSIKFQDFWLADLSRADVIFFFLIPRIYPKLKEKLQRELRPGTKIITYVWPFKDWPPARIDKIENRPTMYLYII